MTPSLPQTGFPFFTTSAFETRPTAPKRTLRSMALVAFLSRPKMGDPQ